MTMVVVVAEELLMRRKFFSGSGGISIAHLRTRKRRGEDAWLLVGLVLTSSREENDDEARRMYKLDDDAQQDLEQKIKLQPTAMVPESKPHPQSRVPIVGVFHKVR